MWELRYLVWLLDLSPERAEELADEAERRGREGADADEWGAYEMAHANIATVLREFATASRVRSLPHSAPS